MSVKMDVRQDESFDDALKRFKRQVSREGIIAETRKREFHLRPGLKRKRKQQEARKKRKFK